MRPTTVNASWIQSVYFSQLSTVGPGTLRYIVAQNTGTTARTGSIVIGGKTFTITQAAGNPLVSQLVWTRLPLSNAPMSRMGFDMAGITSAGESIFYGGNFDTSTFTDTWAWNGAAWTQKSPGHNPGVRSAHAMAYDVAHDQVVLFGGFHDSDMSDETWVWDGIDWKLMTPSIRPPATARQAMAYNPVAKRIVMWGGDSNDTNTWEWDGTNWEKKTSPTAPTLREAPAMAYDAARDEILLFGGVSDMWSGKLPTFYNDTWVWNGSEWKQRKTVKSPSPRTGAKIQYDPDLGQVVLIGGYGGKGIGTTAPYTFTYDYREETWTWDGSDWTQQFPDKSPEFSYNYGLDYDPASKQLTAHLGDDLHCADRGPRTYVLKPGAGAVVLDAYRTDVPAAGSSGTVAVTAAVSWTASTVDAWLTLGGTSSGSSSGKLSYQAAANASSSSRTGTIVVNDKVFVVSQGKGP